MTAMEPEYASLAATPLPELLAALDKIPKRRSSIFTNWAATYRSQTQAIFQPETIDQVRIILELAKRQGKQVRGVGSGHSPSDLVCTNGWGINLDKMQKVINVDRATKVVHAEGGMKLSQFHQLVRPHNLAMSSLGSISDQALAGCISTSTHGSGVTYGNLSTFVRFLVIVLPDENCSVVKVSRDNDPDLFLASLCGLGVTGIIVGVGVECEEDFKLEEECWVVGFEDFKRDWQAIAESGEHVRCWWFPQVGEVKISRMNRTKKPITPAPSFLRAFLFDRVIAHHFHKIALSISRYIPSILPYHAHVMWNLVHRTSPIDWRKIVRPIYPKLQHKFNAKVDELDHKHATPALDPTAPAFEPSVPVVIAPATPLTPSTFRTDLSNNIFNYDCGFPQYTYEGSVPYTATGSTLAELENWFVSELWSGKTGKDSLRGHFPVEIRFTEKDDIWLSPTYGTRGTYIGIIQYRPFGLPVPYKALFRKFESVILSQGGRPHWAKAHNCSKTQLVKMYPKFNDFLAVRSRVDPSDVLINPYIRRHLLGELGEDLDMRVFKLPH